ncbi:hypothetical protein FB451DRAFT_1171450 [Mycena latifolia]|nr:hypothetical protein FB451DRAFT_1171450 [Mycena latifolia]
MLVTWPDQDWGCSRRVPGVMPPDGRVEETVLVNNLWQGCVWLRLRGKAEGGGVGVIQAGDDGLEYCGSKGPRLDGREWVGCAKFGEGWLRGGNGCPAYRGRELSGGGPVYGSGGAARPLRKWELLVAGGVSAKSSSCPRTETYSQVTTHNLPFVRKAGHLKPFAPGFSLRSTERTGMCKRSAEAGVVKLDSSCPIKTPRRQPDACLGPHRIVQRVMGWAVVGSSLSNKIRFMYPRDMTLLLLLGARICKYTVPIEKGFLLVATPLYDEQEVLDGRSRHERPDLLRGTGVQMWHERTSVVSASILQGPHQDVPRLNWVTAIWWFPPVTSRTNLRRLNACSGIPGSGRIPPWGPLMNREDRTWPGFSVFERQRKSENLIRQGRDQPKGAYARRHGHVDELSHGLMYPPSPLAASAVLRRVVPIVSQLSARGGQQVVSGCDAK